VVRREAGQSRERHSAGNRRKEVNAPDTPHADSDEYPSPEIEDQIDREAWKRSGGDLALCFHHRALLVGEYAIWQRGKPHWVSYLRTKALPQYPAVEQSVIEGWRKHLIKTIRLPPKKQGDIYARNCAMMLDALRRKPRDQHADLLKHNAWTFYNAAMRGDTGLFRAVGRLLYKGGKSNYLKKYDYPSAMLSHWLTDRYWLMPAKLVSYRLSLGLRVQDNLKSFLAAKSRYGLKSHQPTLIDHFVLEAAGIETIVLTPDGKRLLGPKGKHLSH
jgi:hypothetical protein